MLAADIKMMRRVWACRRQTTPQPPASRSDLSARYVIENLKQLRDARRLTYRELADRLAAIGRPIPTLGLSRIEKGTRRVDADDLVALAIALGVNPVGAAAAPGHCPGR